MFPDLVTVAFIQVTRSVEYVMVTDDTALLSVTLISHSNTGDPKPSVNQLKAGPGSTMYDWVGEVLEFPAMSMATTLYVTVVAIPMAGIVVENWVVSPVVNRVISMELQLSPVMLYSSQAPPMDIASVTLQ